MNPLFKKPFIYLRHKLVNEVTVRLDDIQETQKHLEDTQAGMAQSLNMIRNSGTFRISENEIMTKISSGAKMYLDPRDIAITPHLVLDGSWEEDVSRAWTNLLKKGDTVFDIGANFGYFGVLAAQQTNRDCRVILFEANPKLIPYLQKTMEVNSFDTCTKIENVAITNKKGKVRLNVLQGYIGSSSLHSLSKINEFNKVKQAVDTAVEVNAMTIDSYCEEAGIKKANIIKMDIEGYEDKAYKGMKKLVKNSPDLIMLVEFTKDAYEDPEGFYKDMHKDFPWVYLIQDDGSLSQPKNQDYKSIISNNSGWVMPVFSKKKLLQLDN